MKFKIATFYLILANIILFVISAVLFKTVAVVIPFLISSILFTIIITFQKELLKTYLIGNLFLNLMVYFFYYVNYFTYGKPYYLGGSDDEHFEKMATLAINEKLFLPSEISNTILEQYSMGAGYISFLAIIMYVSDILGNYHSIIPRLINTNFLIICVIILNYFISIKSYLNLKYQKIFTLILLCTPNMAYINSFVFRDIFNLTQVLVVTMCLYIIIKWRNLSLKLLAIILMCGVLYLMYHTRLQSILFSFILVFPLIFSTIEKYKVKMLAFSGICLLIAYKFLNLDYYIENYTAYILSTASGLSGTIFSLELLPIGIFARFIYGLIIPFPNFFNLFQENELFLLDLGTAFIYVGVVLQIIFLPFIFKEIFKFNWVAISFIAMYLIVIITTFTFRHFIFYYPFLLLLIIKGWKTNNNKIGITTFSIIYLVLFALLYLLLKVL